MTRKRFTAEEIIGRLRQAEVMLSQGSKMADVCRSIGVSEQTSCRWRREYGGLMVARARRLKELEVKTRTIELCDWYTIRLQVSRPPLFILVLIFAAEDGVIFR